MLFMVVETFRDQNARAIYQRMRDKGRMLPDGLVFHQSWVTADLDRCFQIMESADIGPVQRWVAAWSDLVQFEILPVQPGADTGAALAELLEDAAHD